MSEESQTKLHDYTSVVDEKLPLHLLAVENDASQLTAVIEQLLALEKKTRLANDGDSSRRLVGAILTLLFEHKQWTQLNEHIQMLAKRRAQLQSVLVAIVRQGVGYVDSCPAGAPRRALIETLRTVSAGKMFIELERARLTRQLAAMEEAEGRVKEASAMLQEVQVETINTMDMREKAEFLLEQVRLCLLKDDFVHAEIVTTKVNRRVLETSKMHDLKLRFYELIVEHQQKSKSTEYWITCQAYIAMYNTPSVQADESKWRPILRRAVMFLALSAYDSEVADALARLRVDPRVQKLPACAEVLRLLTTHELVSWPLACWSEWSADEVFAESAPHGRGATRAKDLHKRIVQHNLRVFERAYKRIRTARLASLLQLSEEETESYIAELVSSGQLYAKIDRPAGIVNFARPETPATLLNAWSHDVGKLLSLVDKTCHLIHKENMMHRV